MKGVPLLKNQLTRRFARCPKQTRKAATSRKVECPQDLSSAIKCEVNRRLRVIGEKHCNEREGLLIEFGQLPPAAYTLMPYYRAFPLHDERLAGENNRVQGLVNLGARTPRLRTSFDGPVPSKRCY